ncbi:hypothetical protein D3C83_283560 [compost metagenome]
MLITKSSYELVYEKYKLENVLVQDQFIKFIMSYDNDISKRIENFENWVVSI